MNTSDPEIFRALGKEVKDEYGRSIGKIASFKVNPHGQIDSIFVQHGDGEFISYPVDNLRFDSDETVTFISPIKIRGNKLCDEIPLIWRKDQALKELMEKNKIPSEFYEDLHRSFEGALNQLKTEAQGILENIDSQIAQCNKQIRELNSALINLEIEREIGKIEDSIYNNAMEIIQQGLRWANSEKSDLESLKSKLSNVLLGEQKSEEEAEKKEEAEAESVSPPSPSLPEPPEPPVIVYVKNVDKTTS